MPCARYAQRRQAASDVVGVPIFLEGAIACRIERLDQPLRLSFSWGFPDIPDTSVDIRLRRIPGGTHVRLTHSGWDQFEDRERETLRGGLGRAWHTVARPALKAVAEGG